jgi:hypothetical protein
METKLSGKLDSNADGALRMMISKAKNFHYFILDLSQLGDMCVIWRDRKKITDYLKDENIPDHQKVEKLKKINQSKNMVLKNIFTDTTIFGMRKDTNSPIVISDGIHRAIGIQRAIVEQPSVKEKICLRLLLFEGPDVAELEDYKQSINSLT